MLDRSNESSLMFIPLRQTPAPPTKTVDVFQEDAHTLSLGSPFGFTQLEWSEPWANGAQKQYRVRATFVSTVTGNVDVDAEIHLADTNDLGRVFYSQQLDILPSGPGTFYLNVDATMDWAVANPDGNLYFLLTLSDNVAASVVLEKFTMIIEEI